MTPLTLSRRSLLQGSGLAAAASHLCPAAFGFETIQGPTSQQLAMPLKEHAARKGLIYGAATSRSKLEPSPEYAALFASQCGILVPEGELKWNVLRPTPDSFNFRPADWLFDFSRTHNLKFRGHTLVWWQALPGWFTSYANQGNAKQLLTNHISTVVKRYAGGMHSWDVVNEVVDPYDKRSDGLQTKPWLDLAGPEYIDLAFHTARAADSNALLVWNENHLEVNDSRSRAKRSALLALVKDKLKRNVPIDAIGLQSHIETKNDPFDNHEYQTFLNRIQDLGLKVVVSEIDVIDFDAPSQISSRDEMVARTYRGFLDATLRHSNVVAVLTWGLGDSYSWLAKFKPRADGLPVRPLPFDGALNAKPAWTAIARALDAAPYRA